jgi:hypothetical protein
LDRATEIETEPIEQQLKKLLKTAIIDPPAFEKLAISQPLVHRRLLPEDYDVFVDPNRSRTDQTMQVIEALSLPPFVASIDAGDQALRQSLGSTLFWHTYLERAPSNRDIPSVSDVLGYCNEESALQGLFARAREFVSKSRRYDSEDRRRLRQLLTSQKTIESLAASFIGETRTLRNYLNNAVKALALEIQRRSPEVFEAAKTPVHLALVPDLQPVEDYILSETKDYRYDELVFPTSCQAELPIEAHPIRGAPTLPSISESTRAFSPGLLAGLPGSGRTTYLKRMAYLSVAERTLNHNTPLTFYLKARDFLPYARVPQRSIYDFIADKVYAEAPGALEAKVQLCKWLAEHDENGELRLLVDDLDRLPAGDQKQIVAQLAFSNVIFATLPWQVDEIVELMQQPILGKFVLCGLNLERQQQMLTKLAREYPDQDFDLDLALFALDEVPDLAKLPLGIMAIYVQVLEHHSERTRVVRRALEGILERAGVTLSPFQNDWLALNETTRSLIHAATCIVHNLNGRAALHENPASITRIQYEATTESGWGCVWDSLISTRLFEPSKSQDTLRFVNQDIMCYCAATAIDRGNVELRDAVAKSQHGAAQLARQIIAYQDALWEDRCVPPG